jgi:plastocyanin
MYTGSFKLKFEGVDASLETHNAYIPVDDDGSVWHIGINLLDGYEVLSCEGCGDTLEIEGSNAKFSTMESVTITFGNPVVEEDTSECDVIVTIGDDGYSFDPADITIAAGDTVCWMWKDTTDTHNVAEIATKFDADMNLEDAKIGFYSGEAANSVDFRHTFEENDKTHYYVCEPHATMAMAGTVTVGNGTADDPIQAIAEESGLPSIGFVVGVLTLVGAAGLRRRIR